MIKSSKQFNYNKNITHTSNVCDTCENCVQLTRSLNNFKHFSNLLLITEHDIKERYSSHSPERAYRFKEFTHCKMVKCSSYKLKIVLPIETLINS